MYFQRICAPDGELLGIERVGPWDVKIDIAVGLLNCADPTFLSEGDGLITFRCLNGEATYGIVGEYREIGDPDGQVVAARLLSVVPVVEDHA